MDNARRFLDDGEKLLVAMGAAIGGGCGRCAENLIAIAREQGVALEEVAAACREGFAAKGDAVETMKARVAALLQPGVTAKSACGENANRENLASLIRAAAFAAANSAPDVLNEVKKACEEGMAERDFRVCLSIAKTVRKKAEQFSDADVAEATGSRTAEAAKPDKPSEDACACAGSSRTCGCN